MRRLLAGTFGMMQCGGAGDSVTTVSGAGAVERPAAAVRAGIIGHAAIALDSLVP